MFIVRGFSYSVIVVRVHCVVEAVPLFSCSQDQVLILGWRGLVVLSGRDGSLSAHLKLPCQPIAPPVVADFSDDGWNDLILTCADR